MAFELPPGDPCLFCERIVGRRQDWAPIEETDCTISFINPRQFERGQSLVIPRRHAPTFVDLAVAEVEELMHAVHRLAKAMLAAYEPDGLTIYQNNGVASFRRYPTRTCTWYQGELEAVGARVLHTSPRSTGRQERSDSRGHAAPIAAMQWMAEEIRARL